MVLGTLGDEENQLTCSMHIAKSIGCELKGYSSFEKAIESLKEKEIQKVLVPVAYPDINKFIMDDNLVVQHCFVKKIPSLVFASSSISRKEYNELYLHKATKNLVNDIPNISSNVQLMYVDSNEEACKQLIGEDRKESTVACITNLLCADFFDLKVHGVLRKGISMPWVIFRRKENSNEENSNSSK